MSSKYNKTSKIGRWSYVLVLAIGLGLGIIVGIPVFGIIRFELSCLYPIREKPALPADLRNIYQDMQFVTSDGLTLKAWYAPQTNGATILFVHGSDGSRMQLLPEAELLRKQGYGVFLFDSRAHGESEGTQTTFGEKEILDVRAAVDLLEKRPEVDPDRIGALGFSIGASALAMEAVHDLRISAAVLAGTPSSMWTMALDEGGHFTWGQAHLKLLTLRSAGVHVYQNNAGKAIANITPRPVLLIQGKQDTVIPPRRASEIYALAKEPKTLLILKNSAHGNYLKTDAKIYGDALISFFGRSLLDETVITGR